MSWIWNFLAGIGRMSRNAWNEVSQQAKEAELRRMREQGRRGVAPGDYNQIWSHEDSSSHDHDSWGTDSIWGNHGGGAWWQDNSDQGGIFGSSDTSFGDYGGGDFGSGDFGGGFDGGGFDGGGDGGGGD